MTDLIALAKQCGASAYTSRHYPDKPFTSFGPEHLQAFADLIRQDERESCAKTFDNAAKCTDMHSRAFLKNIYITVAAAIRARTTT